MRSIPKLLGGAAGLAFGLAVAATGAVIDVGAGAAPDGLRAALNRASPGDTVRVRGGVFDGPLDLDRSIHLQGVDWPVLDGGDRGTVLNVTAPGARLSGFVVRRSGSSLDQENSGIAVTAADVVIDGNRLEETLFGVYLRQAPGTVVRGNRIASKDLSVARRGDPIRVWYSNHVRIEDNEVTRGRDVVLWYSRDLHVAGNLVQDGRYGLHFMYCDDAWIEGNRLTGNSVGAFLMYSRRLHMVRNTVAHNRGPSGYGIGLKDMDDAVIEDCLFVGNRVGAYVDNSPRELDSTTRFSGCVFAYNDVGIRLLPLVKRNTYVGNSFVANLEQVAVTGGGSLSGNHWAVDGKGNYWSDYAGYDADGDGIGDLPYRAEKLFEQLMDRNPPLRLFTQSPAARALDFAARAFPIFQPQPKFTDPAPLMRPTAPAEAPALRRVSPAGMAWGSALLALIGVVVVGAGTATRPEADGTSAPDEEAPAVPFAAAPASPERPMVTVRDLTVRYGKRRALAGVSFEIPAGEAVALWGPNGAGKTTLLRCLLGLLPYQGDATVASHHTRRDGKRARARIGFVPQELHFHEHLTVRETLAFYGRLKKAPVDQWVRLAERLELLPRAGQPVGELSGGMKQRLALAIALIGDPPVLLLDEPTANLDLNSRDGFLALLQELQRAGKTLVFCSHHLDEVAAACRRIVVLEEGALQADCSPGELADREFTTRRPYRTGGRA